MSAILTLSAPSELAVLRVAFPRYDFSIIIFGDTRLYEAVSRTGDDPIYCLISVSAREKWRELARSAGSVNCVIVQPDESCTTQQH